ncbi:hypothetical protein HCN44_008571 [Aphidius gifuensis]|uniref:Uncharacterized protein n=1 Tax=Aphidius gifuensis TaxID=684658 RepID=A0A835CN55_APHGI|nr:uncharacterized protein LOC122856546 [Aphidius gifuensis]KAF7989897.1 hypothetical protein HCN44_008571 [Aphidius gifuensis]
MSGILRIGLRLVGPTRCIPNNNTTKCLQSMCHVRNGFSQATKNSIASAQKKWTGYWKKICTVTTKTLLYSSPITIFVANFFYEAIQEDSRFLADCDMIGLPEGEQLLKYSIIPSKIITSSVLFNEGVINIKTQDDGKTFTNENTRNLIISEELDANIQEPFFKGKPIAIKVGKLDGLLDNGKLTLKTKEGDTTFTFHHTVNLEVKKTSETLENEIAANQEEQPEIIPSKIGKFNLLVPGNEMTLKTPESEKKWTAINKCIYSDPNDPFDPRLPVYNDLFPITGNFSVSSDATVKIQEDENDEVFYLKQNVNIECDKKLDENSQNKLPAEKELPGDETATENLSMKHILTEEIKTCEVTIDTGSVLFRAQDGKQMAVRQLLNIKVYEDGGKTYLNWLPHLAVLPVDPTVKSFYKQ